MQSLWFRRLALAFFLQTVTTVGVTVHMIAYLIDRGVTPTTAAWAAGLIGAAQTSARVLLTVFGRGVPVELMTALMFGTQMVAIGLLVIYPDGAVLWGAAALLGIGRGALTLLRPAILLEHYNVREFGAVNGALAASLNLANAVAPVATGIAATALGMYQPVFAVYSVLSLVSAIILWSTKSVAAPEVDHVEVT